MEIIKDIGFILKTHEHGNTSQVVTVFSREHGVISGYNKGGNANKKQSICLNGNLVDFLWKARVLGQLGSFDAELFQNFSTIFLDVHRSAIINTVCEIVIACLHKNDSHPEIFELILHFFSELKSTQNKLEILKQYAFFEIGLMSFAGFGYNFSQCNISGEGVPKFISPKTGNAVSAKMAQGFENKLFPIPDFIQNEGSTPEVTDIKKMLDINLHFLKLHIEIQKLPVREFAINLF